MSSSSLTLFHVPHVSAREGRVHAMKNCLSIISAIAFLVEPHVTGESRARLGRLRAATSRLCALLEEDLRNDPIATAEPQSSEPLGAACVATLVESVATRLVDRAEGARVELFVQCGGGELNGDAEALGEALFNLVANAIEASPEGSAVFLSTHRTHEGDQQWAVQDSGCGMPEEQLAELGRRYCSRRVGGTGLGFALAQEAVSRHGGLLRVESAVGAGTRISVWLPREMVL